MSKETAEQAVDALLAQSASEPQLSLVFIGGESLVQRELVEHTIRSEDVRSTKALPTSLMPAGLLTGWQPQEIADLLAYLAANVGRLCSKRELLAEVWRQPYGGADKTVDVHISWLRKALGETAAEPVYLHTKRGVGVRLVDPTS